LAATPKEIARCRTSTSSYCRFLLVDRDWLAEISTDLVDGPQSGVAFKSVLKRLVLSRTFSAADPAPGVCYDLPTGASPDRPSCAIAQIVSNSCATCHSSPMGPGHLDFTHWTKDATGTWWWSHTNENGAPLDPAESRRRIDDRITTTDLTRRMPLLQAFPPDDLRTFHDWLEP